MGLGAVEEHICSLEDGIMLLQAHFFERSEFSLDECTGKNLVAKRWGGKRAHGMTYIKRNNPLQNLMKQMMSQMIKTHIKTPTYAPTSKALAMIVTNVFFCLTINLCFGLGRALFREIIVDFGEFFILLKFSNAKIVMDDLVVTIFERNSSYAFGLASCTSHAAPFTFMLAIKAIDYLILTYQTTYELVRRRRIPYLRGIPERVYPFSKGVCRNLYDFCFARSSIYSLERLPTAMELEEKSRPYTCLDFLTGRCC
ncbi:hypothetical protein NC652_019054 [Populus alba x Populus x berolinensis]|nr:hypothetical protein NC652_019054 [Populus alba x Populus x berolinensis]